MAFSFFLKKQNSVFLDAGSSSVKFFVVQKENGRSEVKKVGQLDTNKFSREKQVQEMVDAVKKEVGSIERLAFNLSSSVFRSGVFEYSFSRDNPNTAISKSEEKQLGDRIIRSARKEMLEYFEKEYGIPSEDLTIAKIKIVEAQINGYYVPYLLGYKGNEIRVRVLGTCLPIAYRELITRLKNSRSASHIRMVHWAEGVERFGNTQLKDGIYIDIGDEMTQIAVVKKQAIIATDGVLIGGDAFTYAVEKAAHLKEDTARDYKLLYGKGEFSEEMRQTFHQAFLTEAKKWYEKVKEQLDEMRVVLPSHVYIMGGTAKLPEVKEVLEEQAFRDLPLNGKTIISPLFPADILPSLQISQKNDITYTPLTLIMYAEQEENS